jgi:hypothetical protein
MNPAYLELVATVGEFWEKTFPAFASYPDVPFDFTGYTAKMQVRAAQDPASTLLFELSTTDNSISLVNGGIVLAEHMDAAWVPETYWYDLWVYPTGPTTGRPWIFGRFILRQRVTV